MDAAQEASNSQLILSDPAKARLQSYAEALVPVEHSLRGYFIALRTISVASSIVVTIYLVQHILIVGIETRHPMLLAFPLLLLASNLAILIPSLSGAGTGWQAKHFATLEAQIENSQLANRLALGEFENELVRAHTPWPLRWLVRSNPANDKREILRRIIAHPQWFTVPPRTHMRPLWQMLSGMAPMLLMVVWPTLLGNSMGMGGAFDNVTVLVCSLFLCMFLMVEVSQKTFALRLVKRHLSNAVVAVRQSHAQAQGNVGQQLDSSRLERVTQLHLIVNQLEQDLQAPAVSGAVALPAAFVPMLLFLPVMLGGVSLWPAILFTASLGGGAWVILHYWQLDYRKWLHRALFDSEIAIRIASGELTSDDIYENTPRPLRFMLDFPKKPKGYADALRQVLWRVTFHLEYYLKRPETYIRGSWILTPMLFLIAITLFAGTFASSSPADITGAMTLLFVALGGALVAPIVDALKVRIWAEEFVAYLRDRLLS
jgi:hypothetical protein